MAWAGLAVLRCATLGIPIVAWLALLAASALCVVLATLQGQKAGWAPGSQGSLRMETEGVGLTWQTPVSGSQTSEWPWQLQRSQVPR